MIRPRIIPCLLLKNQGLVKTVKFKNPTYLGDPINIVRIFNDKAADELFFLDITATAERKGPPWELLKEVADEAFVPFGYGGGIRRIEDVRNLIALGLEKVAVNSYALERPAFISECSAEIGAQSVVAAIDVKRNWLGRYEVWNHASGKSAGKDPAQWAQQLEQLGAGELLLNSVDRDGCMQGYDLELIRSISKAVTIPVTACGGAGSVHHLQQAITAGASAAAAGSMFVFNGPHRAVLISYPSETRLETRQREGLHWNDGGRDTS